MIQKINKKIFLVLLNLIRFIRDYRSFSKVQDGRFIIDLKNSQPCLFDNTGNTEFDRHYIYHTGWAARRLAEIKPKLHHDFSSSLYFVAISSSTTPICFYDYRPADVQLLGLQNSVADLCKLDIPSNSLHSVSCMHVVEHIGLGRYGDPIDATGDLKAIAELQRVTAFGGDMLFVVPIGGVPTLRFNANRIYNYDQVMAFFLGFQLVEFSLITDYGNPCHFIVDASKTDADKQVQGCGCFHFRKFST